MWQRYIDGQYRQPTGLVGRWIGRKMAKQHAPENTWTVDLLGLQPTERVIEIGFGPGIAVEQAAGRAAFVAGVDFSRAMLASAQRRNAEAVRAGRVDLRHGDASALPFPEASFDAAYSIHSIYFWPQPLAALREIRRVLRPGGRLALTVLPKALWNPDNPELAGTPECKPYSGDELRGLLAQAGFRDALIYSDPRPEYPSNYSVVAKA